MITKYFIECRDYLEGYISDHNSKLFVSDEHKRSFVYATLETISNSFETSFKTVLLNNVVYQEDDVDDIVQKCVNEELIYNLLTGEYEDVNTTKVINSADTDVQIIRAAFSIIGMLVTSNQFIDLNLPFTKE